MKEWAKDFYHSKQWIECREAFMSLKFWQCERCQGAALIVHHKIYLTPSNINDPEITLNWDNLEALCQDCHNKEHHGSDYESVVDGLMFDKYGDLIQKGCE